MAGLVNAGEIALKTSFWNGWQFSTNGGMSYEKVGISGTSLRTAMEGNEAAQAEMGKYNTNSTFATITGMPAGFLIGWPLGGYLASGEWEEQWTTWYTIGVPLAIVSTIFTAAAKTNVKRAVSIYNDEEQSIGFDVKWRRPFASTDNGTLVVGVAWSF
jgi:hypothetical protein